MKEGWYFTTDWAHWLGVTQKRPEFWQGPPYPTFRAARMALIEKLQEEAKLYRERSEHKLQQVVEVSYLEEPS
jgi:uncharacterized protein YggE